MFTEKTDDPGSQIELASIVFEWRFCPRHALECGHSNDPVLQTILRLSWYGTEETIRDKMPRSLDRRAHKIRASTGKDNLFGVPLAFDKDHESHHNNRS